jgi:flagellar biosynthesis anti-sigma factor FlgM
MINNAGDINPSLLKAAFIKPAAPSPAPNVKNTPAKENAAITQEPDQVTFSPKAREVQKLAAQAAGLPEVREEKVAEVRDQVINVGNMGQVAAKIAEKLLLGD